MKDSKFTLSDKALQNSNDLSPLSLVVHWKSIFFSPPDILVERRQIPLRDHVTPAPPPPKKLSALPGNKQ